MLKKKKTAPKNKVEITGKISMPYKVNSKSF